MSLHKSIASGKEHRKEYRKAKLHFCNCRNHGSCSWCKGNRLHSSTVAEANARQIEEDFETQNVC